MRFIDHVSLLCPERHESPSDDQVMAFAMVMATIHDLMEDNHIKLIVNGKEFGSTLGNDEEHEKRLIRTGLRRRPLIRKN